MILTSLHVAGFGRLVDRRFHFATGLNVVYGPNESGKSTLTQAIVASLYGTERKKEAWRPWSGGPFATTLMYALAGGERIEVQRDFERDAKGLHVYDRGGNEISARFASQPGQRVGPGEAHLGVPLDVFLNAACVRQQALAVDDGKPAASTAAHLARALDGGPREDAALGAIARLDEALRLHVGTERARKNAPLRALRALADRQQTEAREARARLATLDALGDRLRAAAHERSRLTAVVADLEGRVRSLRAGAITKRLAKLHDFHVELAALEADYAAYVDVADCTDERRHEVEEAFYLWHAAQQTSLTLGRHGQAAQLEDTERAELEQRRRDVGSIGDGAVEALKTAHEHASALRATADAAARDAAAARTDCTRSVTSSRLLGGTLALVCTAIGFAIAHTKTWTGVVALLACVALTATIRDWRKRVLRDRQARAKQRIADRAFEADGAAADAVRDALASLGVERYEQFTDRRARLDTLLARNNDAVVAADRAQRARLAAENAGVTFDRLATVLSGQTNVDRTAHKDAVNAQARRRRERDGIEAHLHALEMRKSSILGSDDERGLESELHELQLAGVAPAIDEPGALRAAENERDALAAALRVTSDSHSRLRGEIDGILTQMSDLAELDERLAQTNAEIGRLEAFERAVILAKTILEQRTREAHQAFARRLEDYAAVTLRTITDGRYGEIFVDPATLAIRVRVPETQSIEDIAALSAGTRDQTYLVVRFAMARMFSEGLETPPLLLDDPFAYWDARRIERCLPILERGARDAQAILFTSSRELADAATRRGAHRVELAEPVLV